MQLTATMNTTPATIALNKLVAKMPFGVKTVIRKIIVDWYGLIKKSRLDGRPGLNRRTGRLSGALAFRVSGARVADIVGQMGFLDRHSAMIARVHELGTVGKGGVLPDIVPRKGKYLRWPLMRGDRAFAYDKDRKFAYAKKVSIPPRLEFYKTVYRPFAQSLMQKRLREAEEMVVKS